MSAIYHESVPLHDNTEYKLACVEVLSEEWPRSASSRLAMLDKSNTGLPYCIVLLERNRDAADSVEVIGHSRLCKVVHELTAGFVESVVVKKNRRGAGLGRKLMQDTETHALRLGLTRLYLCTHDKQGFYQHLGYKFCQPIVTFGSASGLLPEDQMLALAGSLGTSVSAQCTGPNAGPLPADVAAELPLLLTQNSMLENKPTCCDATASPGALPVPPPPPLPPPLSSNVLTSCRVVCSWLVKDLVAGRTDAANV